MTPADVRPLLDGVNASAVNRWRAPVCRIASPRAMAQATATLSERRPAAWDHQPCISGRVHGVRHAGGFAAEQQDVVGGGSRGRDRSGAEW